MDIWHNNNSSETFISKLTKAKARKHAIRWEIFIQIVLLTYILIRRGTGTEIFFHKILFSDMKTVRPVLFLRWFLHFVHLSVFIKSLWNKVCCNSLLKDSWLIVTVQFWKKCETCVFVGGIIQLLESVRLLLI